MENTQTEASTNELEIIQMLRIDARCRINLQRVIVMRGVFEQAVKWIEHLM